MSLRVTSLLAVLALSCAGPALARDLAYSASLSGHSMSSMTGSAATGSARILIHPDTRTVDITLDVQGLKMADLWGKLAFSPKGPIHLHIYGSHDHSAASNSALLFPLPMGDSYSDTPQGFRVVMKNYAYADGAERLQSTTSFEDFVKSLDSGVVVLNIHTNAKPDGEISGDVVPAAS